MHTHPHSALTRSHLSQLVPTRSFTGEVAHRQLVPGPVERVSNRLRDGTHRLKLSGQQ